jgi:hypothetical protein
MDLSFKLEWPASGSSERAIKLFAKTSTGPSREIKRTIILFGDDLIDIDYFDLGHWNYRQSLAVHMLNELMCKPRNTESLVAWYCAIELGSGLLAISKLMFKAIYHGEREGFAELHEEEIRDVFRTEISRESFERYISLGMIKSFLAGERENNGHGVGAVRDQLQLAVTKYLGDELNFEPQYVRSAAIHIGNIDDSVLDNHIEWVRDNPNQFWKDWFQYFANVRDCSLKLFWPAQSDLKPSTNEEAILNKLTRENPVLKAYSALTLPEAAFTYLADFIRSGLFEQVTGIPEHKIDNYVFRRERLQQPHFICSDDETDVSYVVLNDMSLYKRSAEGFAVVPFARDYLVEHILIEDLSSIGKCEKELLEYFGLPARGDTEAGG